MVFILLRGLVYVHATNFLQNKANRELGELVAR